MSRDVCGICWCPYDDDWKCGCKPTQPEALRLADALDIAASQTDLEDNVIDVARWFVEDAAAELRRLHAENEALREEMYRTKWPTPDRDEALLRQAMECLERSDTLGWQANLPVIQAIKERLK